jgi:hypothetical protein
MIISHVNESYHLKKHRIVFCSEFCRSCGIGIFEMKERIDTFPELLINIWIGGIYLNA